jgi:hypothetical protein
MADVIAKRVDDIHAADAPDGAFELVDGPYGRKDGSVLYKCPCGCGRIGALRLRPCDDGPSWAWDGDREAPTLHPSILHKVKDVEHYHGWLVGGVWRHC